MPPPLDINTLITPADEDVTLTAWLNALEGLGIPANSWNKGGTARNILRVLAATYAALTVLIVAAITSGFLELAKGPWLTLLAYYVYGVTRIPATFASGNLTLVNAGGGLYSFGAGEAVFLNPISGAAYTNTAPFTLNPSSTLTIPIQALVAGSASTSPSGTITGFQTNFDATVTASNAADVVGSDAQSDSDLVATCKSKLGSLSPNGPRDSYAYAVRTAFNGPNPVNINRIYISKTSSTGTVSIIVASPSGVPTVGDVAAVVANVEATSRPDTVTVNTAGALALTASQSITVYAQTVPGLDESDLMTLIQNALADPETGTPAYPIGGIAKPEFSSFMFASDLDGIVKSAHPSIFAIDGFTDIPIPATVGTVGYVVVLSVTITIRLVTTNTLAA